MKRRDFASDLKDDLRGGATGSAFTFGYPTNRLTLLSSRRSVDGESVTPNRAARKCPEII